MKPRGSRSDRPDQTVRKVQVLRAYLEKLNQITTVSFDVGTSFDRDGVRGGGSRLGQMTSYLKPEVLLCTSRNDTRAEFIVITSADEPICVDATPMALGTWLAEQGRENVKEEISNSLRVLQSAGSRLSSRVDQSQAAKALNTLKRLLLTKEERPAA